MSSYKIETITVRGFEYHVQCWGDPTKPLLFCLHGWMDCGLSYQLLAPYLLEHYHLLVPDWRGFGNTSHTVSSYWFPDYLADLEVLLNYYSPNQSVTLLAHSMGGHIALMYAGIRPERVAKVISLEGLGLMESQASEMQKRYVTWLDQVTNPVPEKSYVDWQMFKESVRLGNPDLNEQHIALLADAWGRFDASKDVVQLRHDQKHRFINPVRYQHADTLALWELVSAKVAIVMGMESSYYRRYQKMGRIQQAQDVLGVKSEHIYVIPEAHHMLHLEQPELVAQAVIDFI